MLAILELSDYAILGLVLLVGAFLAFRRPSDGYRLARLEKKLNLILKHLGIEDADPTTAAGLSNEVKRLADDPANKIKAIKLHREQTGVSLKEAKDAVEEYMRVGL